MRVLLTIALLVAAGLLAGCVTSPSFDDGDDGDLGLGAVPEATGALRYIPRGSFEPTLGVDSGGAIFMTAMAGLGPDAKTLVRSLDQGGTWEDITANIAGATNYPPNSNDPYVYIDTDTDRVYDFEMQGLSCNMLAYSDDQGDSWTASPVGCTPTQGIQDHQTLFSAYPREIAAGLTPEPVGYDKILYYCVNRVVDSGCAASLDGGLTWGAFRPLVFPGATTEGFCGGLHAHGAGGPDGTIYLPRGHCDVPKVAISEDNGLTWTMVTISPDTPTWPGAHEVTIGIDEAGHVYSAWKGEDRRVYFAASYDRGFTWTDAVDITPEAITVTDFPVIAAGAEGRVAIAYIGTDADPEKGYGEMEIDDHWHAYLTVGTGLAPGDESTWTTARANPEDDPIARGVCGGTRCQASGGGIGDFIDVVIGPDGRPWAAFVDVCHEECIKATELPEEEPSLLDPVPFVGGGGPTVHDKAVGFVGTLATGPALRGDLAALTPIPPLLEAEATE